MSTNISTRLKEEVVAEAPKVTIRDFLDYIAFGREHGFVYSWKAKSKRGKQVTYRKLRTLAPDAIRAQSVACLKGNGKIEGQESYNSFAGWLRENNFDELPQLINLFKRDMGLIGPRPNTEEKLKEFFTGEDLELRRKYKPNAINMDYAFQGETWEETVRNGTQWLRQYDQSKKRHGHALKPTIEALYKFFYNRFIQGVKSE